MVRSAPRIDRRLVAAVAELFDPTEPIAETNRLVGARASELGLPRPSYAQVRRLVLRERLAREERHLRRERLEQLVDGALRRRDPYELFGGTR